MKLIACLIVFCLILIVLSNGELAADRVHLWARGWGNTNVAAS